MTATFDRYAVAPEALAACREEERPGERHPSTYRWLSQLFERGRPSGILACDGHQWLVVPTDERWTVFSATARHGLCWIVSIDPTVTDDGKRVPAAIRRAIAYACGLNMDGHA